MLVWHRRQQRHRRVRRGSVRPRRHTARYHCAGLRDGPAEGGQQGAQGSAGCRQARGEGCEGSGEDRGSAAQGGGAQGQGRRGSGEGEGEGRRGCGDQVACEWADGHRHLHRPPTSRLMGGALAPPILR